MSIGVRPADDAWGSTLIEAVVAIAILTTGLLSLCALASIAARTITLTRERTVAAVLASQKLECLTSSRDRPSPAPAGGEGPADTEVVDYVDAAGRVVEAGTTAGHAMYVRRWIVSPLRADGALQVVRVIVSPCRFVSAAAPGCGDAAATVRLATIRTGATW